MKKLSGYIIISHKLQNGARIGNIISVTTYIYYIFSLSLLLNFISNIEAYIHHMVSDI